MGTENQMQYRTRFVFYLLVGGMMCLTAYGCVAEDANYTHTVTILLPDGTTQEITPPTVCLGVTPPESAWLAEPGPLLPPPESEPLPTDDDSAQNNDGEPRNDDNSDDNDDPPLDEPDAEEPDPCVETPGLCVGALPPHDWQLENFQPFSCGYGATYGLSALQDSVTFVVLLAAW